MIALVSETCKVKVVQGSSMYYGVKRPDTQMLQMRCENCGAQKVYRTAIEYRNRDKNTVISASASVSAFWGFLTWIIATLLLYGVVPYFFGSDSEISRVVPPFEPVALGIAAAILVAWTNSKKVAAAVQVYKYRCGSCNHKWSVRDEKNVSEGA